MTPSSTSPALSAAITDINARRGQSLEILSDDLEEVHVLEDQQRNGRFADGKDLTKFRQYEEASQKVKNFYAEQHDKQTYEYNKRIRKEFENKVNAEMGIWEAMEMLNTFIDDSDPDTELSQIQHLLQSADAMRRDGKPGWMQVTGLIHDLGKLLYFFGCDNQWEIVGDTFPVGCAFDERIILRNSTFQNNPDTKNSVYNTKFGIYEPSCGLDNMMLSWGHDEYLYHVVKNQSRLPDEALAMIRYHSFYPWHSKGAYHEFMNEKDEKMLEAVKLFNPYDLYSKSDKTPDVETLKVGPNISRSNQKMLM